MKTVIARMPFNYNNFGSYALTEKGMDKFDELLSRRLPECIDWCGDELICDVDAPITREDLDINAIIEGAAVQMTEEYGYYPYFEVEQAMPFMIKLLDEALAGNHDSDDVKHYLDCGYITINEFAGKEIYWYLDGDGKEAAVYTDGELVDLEALHEEVGADE